MPAPDDMANAGLRYLAASGAVALLALGAAALFNAAVDPLAMFNLADLPGLNRAKPAVHTRVRVAKAYAVRRVAPAGLILGTSRTHLGLRPSHEGWDAAAAPRYNLAFDGATTREIYLYLRHAQSVRPLKQVVLGLDTWHLTDAPAGTRPGFDAEVLYPDAGAASRLRVRLADLRLLISVDTLRLALETLRAQEAAQPEWFAPDGQRLGEVFFRRPGEMFQEQSPRAYFEHYDRQEISWQMEPAGSPGAPPLPYARTPAAADAGSLHYIGRILRFCREHRIDLRIFTTPSHARNLEIAALTGSWTRLEAGKRRLAELLARDAAAHPGQPEIPFYDFADYSSITTEPLPSAAGKWEMRNYWDSSHFKESVGDLVQDRLLGVGVAGRELPPDFGLRVSASNVEEHLAAVRRRQAQYRASRAADVRALAALAGEAGLTAP
jgi:hypothetical protein